MIRTTLWNPGNKKSLSINLNAASVYDLASFPKIGLDKAKQIIRKREELGYFTIHLMERVGINGEVYANDIDNFLSRQLIYMCQSSSYK